MPNLQPDDYRGQPVDVCQGQIFQPWGSRGFTSIEVLSFLEGRPWDATALGFVHALRPSHLRVVDDGCVQCDSRRWRVTVFLRPDRQTIQRISQEVEVGLPDDYRHAADLNHKLKK